MTQLMRALPYVASGSLVSILDKVPGYAWLMNLFGG